MTALAPASKTRPPLVSIGLPVFNGANYLADAVQSVLAQTFTDFELIICDNASTDRTAAIAAELARRDERIRVIRNAENLGAAPNYNLAFKRSSGRYFKWLAHDDSLLPDYLARTVAAMEARPELVLCNTRVAVIDADGHEIGRYASILADADRASRVERFALFVLRPHTGVDVFGLMRRSALVTTGLHASFHGADRALLAQLALLGPMLQLDEPLLQIREHDQRYTRQATSASFRAAWHDAARRRSRQVPILQLYAAYLAAVRNGRLAAAERRACQLALVRWWLVNWNSPRVAFDLASTIVPGLVGFAERQKTRLFGASPGHLHRLTQEGGDLAGSDAPPRLGRCPVGEKPALASGGLRILTIAASPMPARRGTPVRIERLGEALVARGHEVTLATYHIGEAKDLGALDVVRIDRPFQVGTLPPGPTWAKLVLFDPQLLMTVWRLLRSRQFDVIHAHHFESLLIAAIARPRGMPILYDAHTMLASELPSYVAAPWQRVVRRIASSLDGLLPRLADHIVCAGAGTRDSLIERHGFTTDQVSVAWNGVETEHFATAYGLRDQPGGALAEGAPHRVLYTGTLAAYQDVDLLLEAFARLRQTHADVRLVLATRSQFEPYVPLAEALGIMDAIDIEDDDFAGLPARLAAATLAALPRTRCDGVPQKLLNYMAAGCPVVASQGSAALIDHDITGLVVPNGDVGAFADGMRRLIDDPAKARELGRRTQAIAVSRLTWASTASRVETIFRTLLAAPGTSPACIDERASPNAHPVEP